MTVKYAKHQTPYGVVTETYEDTDKKTIIAVLRFRPNDTISSLTNDQITEIIETVTESIESRYPEGQAPCNLAVQLMRLHMKLIERFGFA